MAGARSTSVGEAVVGYADRLHRALPGGHRVTSPLGAWLVLALAAWVRDVARTADLDRWEAALPAAVERGDVPSQERADAWAAEHTSGLIDRFPITLDARVLLVLCSALATTVSWQVPYEVGPAAGRWADQVSSVLVSSDVYAAVLATPLGDVAVHTAYADGLAVTSVIASANVPDTDVLDLAHRIAADREAFPRRPLSSLPLGAAELWTVTEQRGVDGRETTSVELPAWQAESEHALLADPGTGFPAAVQTLGQLIGVEGPGEARQVALARYGRLGFDAAAVTVAAVLLSLTVERPGPERHAVLHFPHPYAVVATASPPADTSSPAPHPWEGLPVFAAWVGEATEPSDVVTGRTG